MLAALAFALALQQPYPVFETDRIPNAEFAARRAELRQRIGADGVAVVFTNPERLRNSGMPFPFRPDSSFWYLSGYEDPGGVLLLASAGVLVDGQRVNEVLFCPPRNAAMEIWVGYRMGPAEAKTLLGFQAALPLSRLPEVLASVPRNRVFAPSYPEAPTGDLAKAITEVQGWMPQPAQPGLPSMIGNMRVRKSPEELRLMRKAIDATLLGHAEAMRSCEPGMREWEVAAVAEFVFKKLGCQSTAYGTIAGAGANSCVLHYMTNRGPLKPGDLVLLDAGGEYHGYAADVTRTFPASGKFTPEQKAIYEVVLQAQTEGIAECQNGRPFGSAHARASKIIADGLVRLGIIKSAGEVGRYFMHGTSHYLGLDVHDPQEDATLRPGAVLTVEPGIYIAPGSPCDKKWWNIGVRIEDDILVTENGPVNLSGALPKSVAAIEALMAEKGIGNTLIRKAL